MYEKTYTYKQGEIRTRLEYDQDIESPDEMGDSMIVTYWSVFQGDNTGRKYRHSNTGIIKDLQDDPELEPEAAIETWLADHSGDSGKLLSCGHTVR